MVQINQTISFHNYCHAYNIKPAQTLFWDNTWEIWKTLSNKYQILSIILFCLAFTVKTLTLSWWRSLSYRNQFINLLCKSMDWFLYDWVLCRERVNLLLQISLMLSSQEVIWSLKIRKVHTKGVTRYALTCNYNN